MLWSSWRDALLGRESFFVGEDYGLECSVMVISLQLHT